MKHAHPCLTRVCMFHIANASAAIGSNPTGFGLLEAENSNGKIQVGSDDSVILLVDQRSQRILDSSLHRLRVDGARLNRASGARKFGHVDSSRANCRCTRTKDFVLRMQHPRQQFRFNQGRGKRITREIAFAIYIEALSTELFNDRDPLAKREKLFRLFRERDSLAVQARHDRSEYG